MRAEFPPRADRKVRNLGARRRQAAAPRPHACARGAASVPCRSGCQAASRHQPHPTPTASHRPASPPIKLRPCRRRLPRVLLIGSSTGGPQALNAIFGQLARSRSRRGARSRSTCRRLSPPFSPSICPRASSGRCARRVDREAIQAGTIYRRAGRPAHAGRRGAMHRRDRARRRPSGEFLHAPRSTRYSSRQQKSGARLSSPWSSPAWAPMARTALLKSWPPAASVMAQDEPTSVVWGMPGAAAHAGVCSAVLPLDQIAGKVSRLFAGERP